MTPGSCPARLTDNGDIALADRPRMQSGIFIRPSCAVLLLRRLRLSLLPVSRTCPSVAIPIGHHLAACSRAGELGRRDFALESVETRICHGSEAGLDECFRPRSWISRHGTFMTRLEIVAEGLPLHGAAQFATDTTLVSAHRCDRPGAAPLDRAAQVGFSAPQGKSSSRAGGPSKPSQAGGASR